MSSKNIPDILNLSQVQEENISVIRQFFEAAGTGDTSKAHEFIDPDWVSSDAKPNPKL
ncbi:MAG TPA: hypothetical protein VIP53_09000 [Nitrososphaera sp.]|jgi:hypothetical protein